MTWQKMTTLVSSLSIAAFFTGNENLFRPEGKTWIVLKNLHRVLQTEEVSFFFSNKYVFFGMLDLTAEQQE